MPFDNERRTTTKRQTISDRLKESLKNAQAFKRKQELQQAAQDKKKDAQKESRQKTGSNSNPFFKLDDSAARAPEIDPNANIDRDMAENYMQQASTSHYARMTDQDEVLVNNETTVKRSVETETVTVNRKRIVGNLPASMGDDAGALPKPKPKEEFAVALSSREIAVLNQTMPKFYRVKDLPGYMLQGIRMLGRSVFRSFPSYNVMEELCREARVDPLGQIRMMSTITHHTPSDRQSMNDVAGWIVKNGTVVDMREIDFGRSHRMFQGYVPQVIISVVDDVTYVLVREDGSMGGPMGEQFYIYIYSGGHVPNLIEAGETYSYDHRKLLR